jgi:hypothetical protein
MQLTNLSGLGADDPQRGQDRLAHRGAEFANRAAKPVNGESASARITDSGSPAYPF